MKVDTGVMAPSLTEIGAAGQGARGHRLRRAADGRDRARPVPAARDRGRAHRAHRARHRHRGRVRPHADGHSRTRRTTCSSTRRAASSSGSARRSSRTSRSGSRCRGRIRRARMREYILAMRAIWASWNDGAKLDFRGDFYRHTLMTPFFAPGPNPYGAAEGVPRRGRRADDRGRGRGRRRHHHPRLHDRAVREGGHDARDRARAREGRAGRASTFEVSGPLFVVTGTNEEEIAAATQGVQAADRVLRLDARVPRRARAARLGRSADRAQPAVEAGRVGGDGRAHRRRRSSTRSRSSPSPKASAPSSSAATAASSTAARSTRRTRPTRSGGRAVIDDLEAA